MRARRQLGLVSVLGLVVASMIGSGVFTTSGSCLLAVFASVHAAHVQRGTWVQNMAVLAKLLLIAVLLGLAAPRLNPAPAPPAEAFSAAKFAMSLLWVSFSYSGWNAAAYI